MAEEDHLAYGDHWSGDGSQDRGLLGDTYRKFRGNRSDGVFSSFLDKVQRTVQDIGSDITEKLNDNRTHSHTHANAQCTDGFHNSLHRYDSFAGPRDENDVKWFVDGCGYMWAVSVALEQARTSIWILDWWLSPELYLRRPPSRNEKYRLDRMLQAAAQRGVKVNIIVYKEVEQALTRKYLSPTLPRYLKSLLPRGTDAITSTLTQIGVAVTFASLEYAEAENPLIAPPLTVLSSHTKHALEALHPNISVFRHPDHLPDAQTLQSSFLSSLQNLSLTAATASRLPGDALKAIYGMNEDVILYWAHHEKLCLVDGGIAFMGGLDLCYGRWDTNQHPIADAHPANLDDIVFPGQDYNNARIMDFSDVSNWENNKLDRRENSRMGWSDLSISLRGPAVEDLRAHFVERWNFIYNEKYDVRKDTRYSRLTMQQSTEGIRGPQHLQSDAYPEIDSPYVAQSQPQHQAPAGSGYRLESNQQLYFPPPPVSYRGMNEEHPDAEGLATPANYGEPSSGAHHHLHRLEREAAANIKDRMGSRMHRIENRLLDGAGSSGWSGSVSCQIVRSCTKWSHGVPTEHSIANAYIAVIRESRHFVYIENQFFITATSDAQKPVVNKIGAALVERICRAARVGEKYKVIIVMPAVPAFAGDLKDESSLGTRAIMEFQYNSINRGGNSIMELIAAEGFDPTEYIRFYNLRNYDRINVSAAMRDAEQASGVDYEHARRQHDDAVDPAGYHAQQGSEYIGGRAGAQKYQLAAQNIAPRQGLGSGRWDSVVECYMLDGLDIREVPWENGNVPEIEAFVSEELYIHSKILIADDRIVICGSANLNDRSQLGHHDSEIAVVIEDSAMIDSRMDGQPWQASKFAATLRRQLFKKHLGLLPPQNMEQPDQNFLPAGTPNIYDFGTPEDQIVADPLSNSFLNLWNGRAKQNTLAFGRIFHPVPHDSVRTWKDYNAFYECFFRKADLEADGKKGAKKPPKYQWGHVVAEDFSPGEEGLREVKDLLSSIKGTLVEMPLLFLIDEDIAKEGLTLNAFTEEVYT